MIIVITIVGGWLFYVLLAARPFEYLRDADGFGRWRWRTNCSLPVLWKIWRPLHDQPCAVSWKRRFRVPASQQIVNLGVE